MISSHVWPQACSQGLGQALPLGQPVPGSPPKNTFAAAMMLRTQLARPALAASSIRRAFAAVPETMRAAVVHETGGAEKLTREETWPVRRPPLPAPPLRDSPGAQGRAAPAAAAQLVAVPVFVLSARRGQPARGGSAAARFVYLTPGLPIAGAEPG